MAGGAMTILGAAASPDPMDMCTTTITNLFSAMYKDNNSIIIKQRRSHAAL